MNNILVSISCITYNHEKYIAETIESFLAQKTNFNFEILIHDDASTDNTQQIIKQYEEKYPKIIKPIYQKENQHRKKVKISATFIFPRAKGKYLAFCEGDDYWTEPYKLQKQFELMELNPSYSMITHSTKMIDANGCILRIIRPYRNSRICEIKDIFERGDFVATNSLFLKKEYLNPLPSFYYKCPIGDYPIQIYAALKGDVFYIDEIMSTYRYGLKNSWSYNNIIKPSKDKKITYFNRMLETMNEINKFTNNKYIGLTQKKKDEYLFQRELLQKKTNLRRLKKYKLPLNFKVNKYLYYKLPCVFKLFKKVKYLYKSLLNKLRNIYEKST